MPEAEFFSRLGLFVHKSFLDADTCARIRADVRSGVTAPRKIARGGVELLDEQFRKSSTVTVAEATRAYIDARFAALRPELERWFGLPLPAREPPYFGAYRAGDFFLPHADRADHPEVPERIRSRQVTAVVFLNGGPDDSSGESYDGGALVFYGLIDDPAWTTVGFPLAAGSGTLIAFRANVVHEVEPVISGVRYTIVTRFCRAADHAVSIAP